MIEMVICELQYKNRDQEIILVVLCIIIQTSFVILLQPCFVFLTILNYINQATSTQQRCPDVSFIKGGKEYR
jgi:hypothetical protein